MTFISIVLSYTHTSSIHQRVNLFKPLCVLYLAYIMIFLYIGKVQIKYFMRSRPVTDTRVIHPPWAKVRFLLMRWRSSFLVYQEALIRLCLRHELVLILSTLSSTTTVHVFFVLIEDPIPIHVAERSLPFYGFFSCPYAGRYSCSSFFIMMIYCHFPSLIIVLIVLLVIYLLIL